MRMKQFRRRWRAELALRRALQSVPVERPVKNAIVIAIENIMRTVFGVVIEIPHRIAIHNVGAAIAAGEVPAGNEDPHGCERIATKGAAIEALITIQRFRRISLWRIALRSRRRKIG